MVLVAVGKLLKLTLDVIILGLIAVPTINSATDAVTTTPVVRLGRVVVSAVPVTDFGSVSSISRHDTRASRPRRTHA